MARLLLTNCSSSLIWVRMRAAWEKYSSPSEVRLIERVVRLTKRIPKRASSAVRRLLTAGGVMPSSRAVAARLPLLANR
ncbi:hypothetical protein D3C85_1540100 [compost metagenome]